MYGKWQRFAMLALIAGLAFGGAVVNAQEDVEIITDLPSIETLEQLESTIDLVNHAAVGGNCDQVILLEPNATANVCINYEAGAPYFVAVVTGTTESVTSITVLKDGEIIQTSLADNSGTLGIIVPTWSAGQGVYEVLLQQTRQALNDDRTEIWSFQFDLAASADESGAEETPTESQEPFTPVNLWLYIWQEPLYGGGNFLHVSADSNFDIVERGDLDVFVFLNDRRDTFEYCNTDAIFADDPAVQLGCSLGEEDVMLSDISSVRAVHSISYDEEKHLRCEKHDSSNAEELVFACNWR